MGHSNTSLELVPAASSVCEPGAGVTARDVAAVLFRRQRIILAVFVAVLGGAAGAVTWLAPYLSPPRFTSTLKFIVKKERVDALVTPGERSMPGLTTSVTPAEVYSEIELLKSADVVERLARETGLEGFVERLRRDLVVEPVTAGRHLTNLIAVGYAARDATEVARVLGKLPEIYLEKHLSMNRRPAALEYFRGQAETFEQELRQGEQALAEFEKQSPAAENDGHREAAGRKLAEMEKQRLESEAAIREADSRAMELERQSGALPATVAKARAAPSSPYLERLGAKLLELENQRSQTRLYREIEKLDQRMEETRQAMAAEERTTAATQAEASEPNPLRAGIESERLRNQVALAGLRSRRASLLEEERACRQQMAASRGAAAESNARWKQLIRDVKQAEENFLLYRKKYAEVREAESLDEKRVLNVAVAEEARPPAETPRRRPWFYVACGLVIAVALAGAAGFGVEMLDHSIHTPRQLENCASLAVLAWVPEGRRR